MDSDDFQEGLILPPLIIQLKKILDQYPDDTQILKELIQNAEDAGASEVKFLYDQHSYNKDPRLLEQAGLAEYQGPALYAYNDGIFNEEDWRGIRMLSQSVKQDDRTKVGYFGMGFKSVFHLTDLPYIVSGDRIGVIDPHQNFFPQNTYSWSFSKVASSLKTKRHQFEPFFDIFDCKESSFFSGSYKKTLFRFPLRNKPSALSEKIYTDERMRSLFDCFEEDSHMILLFLKNLERVELYERDSYEARPKLTFEVKLSDECIDLVRQKRRQFIRDTQSGKWLDHSLVSSFRMTIETIRHDKSGKEKKSYNYLVTHLYCGGNMSTLFKRLCNDPDLHNSPWVGTAMSLDTPESPMSPLGGETLEGHVFCFLPLPFEQKSLTGLPVHLNGFFALEHNRKYVKWPSLYRTTVRDELVDKRLLWNQCLLREALPRAYTEMILHAIKLSKEADKPLSADTIYRAFPDMTKVERKWESMLQPFYADVFAKAVILTGGENPQWVEVKDAILDTLEVNNNVHSIIEQILFKANSNIANIPPHVKAAVKRYYRYSTNQVTHSMVSSIFREVQHELSLQWESKMHLLRYFLSDFKYDLLDGLDLLPLANGGFHTFYPNAKRADRPIYIPTKIHPQSLLPGLEDDFIDPEIDADIMDMLMRGARRGLTQLEVLKPESIVKELPRCLPPTWLSSFSVEWDPEQPGHPPESWLPQLWHYLTSNHASDLSAFEKLPIVPIKVTEQNTELIWLGHKVALICKEFDGTSLEDTMVSILQTVGVTVIDELPSYIKAHPLTTRKYTFMPTHIGVLKSIIFLTNVEGLQSVLGKLEALRPEEKRCLRLLFSKVYPHELKSDYREVLKHLPLFETMKQDNQPSSFASCVQVNLAAPSNLPPIPLSQKLLDVSGTDSQNLAVLLDVTQLNQVELLTSVVFPDIESAFYEPENIQEIMLFVLKNYYSFQEMSSHFKDILKSLPFIPRKDLLVPPCRFYDPDHELLQNLFLAEEQNFPHGVYSDSAIVSILREIGLRGPKELEPEDLLESAYVVQELAESKEANPSQISAKSDAIMEYLMKYPEIFEASIDDKPLSEELSDINWVKVQSTKTPLYPVSLTWFASDLPNPSFQKPRDVTSREYAELSGSIQSVVSISCSNFLAQQFGWQKEPELIHVIKHFANIVQAYAGSEKAKYTELVSGVYQVLTKSDVTAVLEALEAQTLEKWIWHGDGFCAVEQAVFEECFMDLSPFVYHIPNVLQPLEDFFQKCGVNQSCNLTNVLKQVQQKYASVEQVSDAEAKRDLHICVSVLNELKTNLTDEGLSAMKQELVVPVHTPRGSTLRMEPIWKCSYCDEEWLRQGRDLSDLADLTDEKTDEEPLLVHPNVPSSTSEALGVPTLMSRVLEAEELDFSFGQSDSLTHRLHTLLQDYTDGFAVPKELVQNADDAGATEVMFLYDERHNEDALTCLIDEGMRECQGPALWAYNDAIFTDDDFENICKLSGATKESQTDKIGRFGLGFNAVYNLTDVPSFVSRHNIVIFDPHTTHLGRSIKNKSKPGIKIDMRKHRRKLRRIGNQFKPYNDIFGCDLSPDAEVEDFDGTLFRFPLRTRSQASRSEISDKHYDDAEMRALLKMLVENADSLLLFTQNVCKIGLYHLPAHSTSRKPRPIELMRVEKKAVSVVRELLPKMAPPPTASKLSDDMKEMIQQSSILKASSSVMHRIKLGSNLANLELPSASQVIEVECYVSEGATNKLQLSRSVKVKQWLISSHMGTGDALQMAASQAHLIPCAGVAVPVSKSTEQDNSYTPQPILSPHYPCPPAGAVFSYMPLPVQSGMPVHINAAFAISSSRRHLCEKNEDDKFDTRALWNETLLKDAVCEAYMNLLTDLSVIAAPSECGYPGVWPNLTHTDTSNPLITQHLASQFYSRLVQSPAAPFFSDGLQWRNFEHVILLSPELETHSTSYSATALRVARHCLKDTGDIVIYLPEFIRKAVVQCGQEESLQKHTYTTEAFYSQVFLPNIGQVECIDRDTLVLQALSITNSTAVLGLLRETACIPVTPKGHSLKRPAELIDPASELALLFSGEDEAFPYGVFQERNTLEVLRGLGLKAEKLSWSETVRCARSLQTVPYQTASRRIPVLLKQLERNIQACDNDRDIKDKLALLQDIHFLQPMKKPGYFPFSWKSCSLGEQALLSPRQLYHPVHVDTVCLTEPILDLSTIPTECVSAIDCLHMSSKEPHIDSVLQQLEILADTDNESCLTDNRIFKDVHRICMAVYELLQFRCDDPEIKKKVTDRLQSKPFILAHGRFLLPSQLAFEFTQNCPPYLYSIPDTLRKNYDKFLRLMGVRDHFEASDYVHALQDMQGKYGDQPLKRDVLKIALQLVNLLNEAMTELDQSLHEVTDSQGTIYIPDARGVLLPSQDLCFNEPDVNWVPTTDFTSYSHPHIPFTISKQLGVSTKRQDVLSKHSHGIPFGQKERLTNRLRRILSGYPCDKEILKEMLQNADDAEASEIHFINDPRQHKTDRVFDESWKPLQGPALCVFNDKPFNEVDMVGIQRLGEGSKSIDPNKTGQYGVGFNCVYHLTDAPSFLTAGTNGGHSLCVFDPHGKYVPGATSEEPGRRYDDVGELRQIFTDIFPCYLEDKFPVHQGTMFRFPLRTPAMAEESELSEMAVTPDDVSNLFSKFRSEMFDCLLFVNHVKSITLTEMDKVTGRVSSSYTVCAELSPQDSRVREEFSRAIADATAKVKEGNMQVWNIPNKEVTYVLDIADSQGYSEKWLVHQKVGFEEGAEISASLIEALKRRDLSMLPRGGVAALLDRTGQDPSQKRASKAFCFLPLPVKTHLPININGHFALDHEARRNLWTDDDKTPKSEWNNLLLQHVIGPAYVTLLREMPAHISTSCPSPNTSFMEEVDQQVPAMDTYSNMFPRMNHSDPYWRSLAKAVYQHIHNFQEPVLPVVRSSTLRNMQLNESNQAEVEWMTTTGVGSVKPYFDSLDSEEIDELSVSVISSRRRLTSTPKRKPQREKLKEALINCGLKLIRLPLDIYQCFLDSGVPVECLSPELVVDFFKGYRVAGTTCTLSNVPIDLESSPLRDEDTFNSVLNYCIRNEDYFLASLVGLPLLLTEDNQIREYNADNTVYLTSFTELLPQCGSQFIHHRIVNGAFKGLTPGHSETFERFDVYAFASLLPNVLKEPWYRKESEHAIWIEEEDELPTREWICKVWEFLRSEFERILSIQHRVDSQEELLKGILRPLEDWALLPAHLSEQMNTSTPHKYKSYSDTTQEIKQLYLIPLGLAHTILDFTQTSVTNYSHRAALRNLGLPEINNSILDGGNLSPHGKNTSPTASNANLARLLVANMEKPITVLQSLAYAFDMGNLSSRLRPEDCSLILKYLNDCTDSWKEQKECVLMLRDLPMFLSVHGDFVKIGGNTAYVLPSDIPQIDLEIWEKDAQVIFLRKNSSIEKLFNNIGCISLSASQVYSQFTFQNFGRLSPEGRIKHLEFIRDIKLPQLKGEERESFTSNLQNLRFLERDGLFKCASEYYDPYNPVFKAMLANDPTAFPPKPFCEFKWLDFMKSVGLQQEVTKAQFTEFAQKVADEAASNPSESTFNKSRTLVIHLFHRSNVATEGILEDIADIAFIPVAKVNSMLGKIYSPLAQKQGLTNPYIRFSEGVPENHEALVWSSCHLLPDWANPFKINPTEVSWNYDFTSEELCDFNSYMRKIANLVGLKEEPEVKDVLQHTKNICSNMFSKHTNADDLKAFMKVDVMKLIYKFLQNKSCTDDMSKEYLSNTNCVLVDLGYTFVKPNQVVIDIYEEDQIAPYLYKLPTELGEFKNLFLHLGATEHAIPEQYAMVLENMYRQTMGAKLHPNEMRIAFKAVREIFTSLQRHSLEDLSIDMLFLPSSSGRLLASIDLIFNNFQGYSERISQLDKPFLVDLAECGLSSKIGTFEEQVKLMPKRLRPPKLTTVVLENLEEVSRTSISTHGICDKIKHQLNSRAFAQGIVRLIKHEHHRSGHRVKKEVLDRIQNKLKKVKVFGVDTLITYLTHGGERVPESESQCECFAEKQVDEDNTDTWTLYIDNSLSMNEELLVGVAEFVNRISGGLLNHSVHYLQPILSCSPHSIYRILDRLKIRPDHSIDFKQPTLPTPGSFVPIEDHHLLNEDFNHFEPGEYVAYELSDDDSGGQTFVYAIIIDKLQLDETDAETKLHLMQMYSINVGDDRKLVQAVATDLYKFHRVEGFVSRNTSTIDGQDRLHSFTQPPHSPFNSFRDSYSSQTTSFSESFFEPSTPKTTKNTGRSTQQRDEVFSKIEDIKEDVFTEDEGRRKKKEQVKRDKPMNNGDFVGTNGNTAETQEEEVVEEEGYYQKYKRLKEQEEAAKAAAEEAAAAHAEACGQAIEEYEEVDGAPKSYYQPGGDAGVPNAEVDDEGKTAEQLLEEISDVLDEAWTLPQGQRKKVIKRLLLKWHPDKNLGNERFATMITQHIQSEIERLEQGLPRPSRFDDLLNQFNFDPRNPFTTSSKFQQNFYKSYQYFFDQVNERAKEHKKQRERYKEFFSKEYNSKTNYNFEVPPTFTSSNPQPNQAKRFLKQAQEDLRATDNDYDTKEPSYEWVCFKAHQAAEKALKAAQFSVDAVTSFNHDLTVLAATLEDLELRRLAMKLQRIIGDTSKLYNPDPIDFLIIPHEEYSKEMACDAVMCSTDILERVKEFVELRD